jgi:hypothetical protein
MSGLVDLISTAATVTNLTVTNINGSAYDISGFVYGPASSIDNTIPRFDGLTGKLLQGSTVVVDDTGAITGIETINGIDPDDLVIGPATSDDERLARFDGTTGKLLQNSLVSLTDAGAMSGLTNITSTAATITALTVSTSLTGAGVADIFRGTALASVINTIPRYASTSTYSLKPSSIAISDADSLSGVNDLAATSATIGTLTVTTINSIAPGNIVIGPTSSNDERLARFDGTTGKLLQNSIVVLTDAGAMSGLTNVTSTAATVTNLTVTNINGAAASSFVTGPASSTDNTIVRFDGLTGKLVQGSSVAISDGNEITGVVSITSGSYTATGTLSLLPNSSSPIIATTSGDTRGNYATDWQRARSNVSEVASGAYSVIAGGSDGTAAGDYSVVCGGLDNMIGSTAHGSIALGGYNANIAHPGCMVFNATSTTTSTPNAARQIIFNLLEGNVGASNVPGVMLLGGSLTVFGDVTCNNVTATTVNVTNLNSLVAADIVTGPASATEDAIVRYDGTTGKVIKNSNCTIDDAGTITASTLVSTSGTLSTTTANTSIYLLPSGTGGLFTSTTGNARGQYAIDLQITRGFNDRVAAGDYAVISGGYSNGIASTTIYSSVMGGGNNLILGTAQYSSVLGGRANLCEANNCTAAGLAGQARHDYSFVWGSSLVNATATTAARQIVWNVTGSAYTVPAVSGFYINGVTSITGDTTITGTATVTSNANVNNLWITNTSATSGATASALNYYELTTFNTTAAGALAGAGISFDIRISRLDKTVTMRIPAFAANATAAGTPITLTAIPARFRPPSAFATVVQVRKGSVALFGHVVVESTGVITMYTGATGSDTWAVGETAGTYNAFTLTFVTNQA